MSSTTSRRPRRAAAIALAIVGVAGLSLASASQLDLVWGSGQLQAGNVAVDAGCQGTAPVTVSYGAPTFTSSTTNPWSGSTVDLTGIEGACGGKHYEIAYSVNGASSWTKLGSTGAVSGTSISANIASIAAPESITNWALTIY
ncbi:hypothetical protein [Sanguibacter sp. HDW7]|uniref:hypothetical protein n=1 Tax=Sanguibacter sp. HDW7 TaxID=2714931 RepID=UPI00140A8D90|nr:hypothetical protein [Sanguibacter sp. HDW7]QIK84349.1 hypothetical protein G7063_12515 [Sanguibacter sp. HDW7]